MVENATNQPLVKPQEQLITPRLTIRPLQDTDASAFFGFYSDADTMKYMSRPAFTDMNQARRLVNERLQYCAQGNGVCWVLELTEGEVVVGSIDLFKIEAESKRAEIGYVLAKMVWGQGIMTEAMNAVIRHSFNQLQLNRLEADIDPENDASARLLKKCGFQLEGLLKQRWIVAGKVTDSEIYGLVAEDWSPPDS